MYQFHKMDYCIIYTDSPESLVSFRIHWTLIGDDSVMSTDREKIARYICNTPHFSEYFCKNKIHPTEDILLQLALSKDLAIRIAQCFLEGKVNKPLARDIEEEFIDELQRDEILLLSEFYQNYWKILNTKWNKIKKIMKEKFDDFSFTSEIELIKKIIDEHLSEPFINYTTSKYKAYSPYHQKTMWKFSSKGSMSDLSNKDRRKLCELTREHGNNRGEINKWTGRFLDVCQVLAEKDSYIATHLTIHKALVKGQSQFRLKVHCNPSLSSERMRSHAWINGEVKWLNNS